MAMVYGDTPPPGLLAAFEAYEQALANDDLAALDDAFVDDERALRGDAAGLLVGHARISAYRGGRGGAPRRAVRQVHARRLGPDHAVLVSVNEPSQGGAGLVTQVWERCADRRWRICVAQVTGPGQAADSRVWRLLGFPLVAPSAPGVLDGEDVVVKDLFAVAGFPVGAGNPAYLAEAVPEPAHAAAVRALLDAGAQVRGIARTDEFAYSIAGANAHYGTPPNPRAPHHLPGGSSSGPASAVAMGHASIGLGTDTAGSIRVPASYQGLWGLRSTHGAVSREGLLALAPSFDTVGWLTRGPELLASTARVSLPPAVEPGGEFVLWAALLELADPVVRRAFTDKVNAWVRAGALAEPRAIRGPDPKAAFSAFRTVQGAEAWRTHGAWIRRHPDALGPDLAARFAWAATITADEERAERANLDAISAHLEAALEDRILLLPATPTPAPPRGAHSAALDAARTATISLTCLAAITGRPALSAPCLHADGAPVGLGLIGPRGSDLDLVARAAALAG
jgi:Asp-tRNA(Asn)/Glu-tRNA(Gln) amidotransferase A subunit family amidase